MRVCLNLRFHRGGLALPAALPLACICSLVGFIWISCFAIFATLIFAYRRCCVTSPHVVIALSRLWLAFSFWLSPSLSPSSSSSSSPDPPFSTEKKCSSSTSRDGGCPASRCSWKHCIVSALPSLKCHWLEMMADNWLLSPQTHEAYMHIRFLFLSHLC